MLQTALCVFAKCSRACVMNLSVPATASSILVLPPASSFRTTIRGLSSHRPRRPVDRPGRSVPLPPSLNNRLVAAISPPELATDYLVVFVVLVVVLTHRERVATPMHVHEPRRLLSQCRRHSVPPRITHPLSIHTLATYVRYEPTDQLCVMTQGRQASSVMPSLSSRNLPPHSLQLLRTVECRELYPFHIMLPGNSIQCACARQYYSGP